MLKRRQFLSAGAIGAGFLLPAGLGALSRRSWAQATTLAALPAPRPILGSSLKKYLDELPIPSLLDATRGGSFNVGMTERLVKVLPSNFSYPPAFPGTTVWSYYDKGGVLNPNTYLGPTIVATKGTPISVTWYNELPSRFLPTLDSRNYSVVDWTLMGMGPGRNTQGPGAAVVHRHGGEQLPHDDGLPWQWFGPGLSATTNFSNDQPGSLIWYHDHAMGMTRLNVFAGLSGGYLIVDPSDPVTGPPGNLGVGIPLVLQDRMFDTHGQFYYPINPLMGTVPTGYKKTPWPGPSVPEFFGDTILVNGKVWPKLTVEARKYRFRIINGAQARFFKLFFKKIGAPDIVQIGAEGGYLPAPVTLASLLIAPGERADMILDFKGLAGKSFILSNDANAPYADGDPVDPRTTGQVMRFDVVHPTSRDTSVIPAALPGPAAPDATGASITEVVLFEQLAPSGDSIRLQLGPGGALGGLSGGVPFDATIPFGTGTPLPIRRGWNVIRFINTTVDVHPMHTHLFMYQVLGRQAFDPSYVTPTGTPLPPSVNPFLQGSRTPPDPNETGLKDTVMCPPGQVTSVLAYVPPAFVGLSYVLHCHILEHEEKDMMIAFTVT